VPVFLVAIIIKVILTYLFYKLINIFSFKKNDYIDVANFFLQGGVINQLLPGVGFVYKYYRLKYSYNINLIEFTTAQIIWSLFVFTSYIILAIVLGFVVISFSNFELGLLITIISSITLIFYLSRKKLYRTLRNNLIYNSKITELIKNLKKIKDLLFTKFFIFLFIFIGFILLGIIECINFYHGLTVFGGNVSFISSNFIFITSSLASFIAIINFFGLFEFILTLSSSFIIPEFNDMLVFAFAFRIINLTATFTMIICLTLLKYLKNIMKKKTYD
tara:strand:- start:686 stop:1510 length:825 start_codon:yes stop_codon:yes gene_type:complete